MTSALTRRLTAAAAALVLFAPAILVAQATDGTAVKTPQLDFSGWIFGSFQYRSDSATKAVNGNNAANQFGIDRLYLTFRMPAGDRASIRATTDIFQQTNSGYYSGWAVRLKYGYLQYDVARDMGGNKGFNFTGRIGMLHTVEIDHEETFWPRFYTMTGIERNAFFSSADMGAAGLLALPGGWGEIYGTITNGSGYTSNETDRFKDFAIRVSLTPFGSIPMAPPPGQGTPQPASSVGEFFRTFTITPWIYKGYTASKFQNDPATVPAGWEGSVSDGLARDRWGIFTGIKDRRLTIAGTYAHRTEDVENGSNTSAAPRAVVQREGHLLSGFVVARPLEWGDAKEKSPVGIVARIDQFKPNSNAAAATLTTSGPDATDRFLIGGLFWDTTSRATLALDFQSQTRVNGSRTPEQRTIFLHYNTTF